MYSPDLQPGSQLCLQRQDPQHNNSCFTQGAALWEMVLPFQELCSWTISQLLVIDNSSCFGGDPGHETAHINSFTELDKPAAALIILLCNREDAGGFFPEAFL